MHVCGNQCHTQTHTFLLFPFPSAHEFMSTYTPRYKECIEPSHGLMFGRMSLDLLSPLQGSSVFSVCLDIQPWWSRYTWVALLIEAFYQTCKQEDWHDLLFRYSYNPLSTFQVHFSPLTPPSGQCPSFAAHIITNHFISFSHSQRDKYKCSKGQDFNMLHCHFQRNCKLVIFWSLYWTVKILVHYENNVLSLL